MRDGSREFDSYRDPQGFIFRDEGIIYRAVSDSYRDHYETLMNSGLADRLVGEELLIPHEDFTAHRAVPAGWYKILLPEQVPFISYPWEWSFFQLRDAALTTLRIQEIALEYGMTLKDASSLNIQFVCGRPVLIDTLSFARYEPGTPWIGYRQFCEQFLCPLAIGALVDENLISMSRRTAGTVSLELARNILGRRGLLSAGLFFHLYLQLQVQKRTVRYGQFARRVRMPGGKKAIRGLIASLEHTVTNLRPRTSSGVWSHYYDDCPLSEEYLVHKQSLIEKILNELHPTSLWDLGCNNGVFSKLAVRSAGSVLSLDSDCTSIGQLYTSLKESGERRILPLVQDLANPSPGAGWMNREFRSLFERGPCDVCMALALIHHLAIGRNLPFGNIVEAFRACCARLVIEFVPKDDPSVQTMLDGRADVFADYSQEQFEMSFERFFAITSRFSLASSRRVLYVMKKKAA